MISFLPPSSLLLPHCAFSASHPKVRSPATYFSTIVAPGSFRAPVIFMSVTISGQRPHVTELSSPCPSYFFNPSAYLHSNPHNLKSPRLFIYLFCVSLYHLLHIIFGAEFGTWQMFVDRTNEWMIWKIIRYWFKRRKTRKRKLWGNGYDHPDKRERGPHAEESQNTSADVLQTVPNWNQ